MALLHFLPFRLINSCFTFNNFNTKEKMVSIPMCDCCSVNVAISFIYQCRYEQSLEQLANTRTNPSMKSIHWFAWFLLIFLLNPSQIVLLFSFWILNSQPVTITTYVLSHVSTNQQTNLSIYILNSGTKNKQTNERMREDTKTINNINTSLRSLKKDKYKYSNSSSK